jgi:adenosine 3'-phospho 5'-phosphosulfate transporter B3
VRKAPINAYVTLTIALTAARILTYWSLVYLNYPTQIIFKSMKLPVVIVGNFLMFRKVYPTKDYASAVLLSLSAALFSLGDAEVSPVFSLAGIVIVVLSLIGDAIFSNMQEKILQTYKASSEEMLLYSNFFGGAMSFVGILFSGELFQALSHISRNSWILWALMVRSVILYIAVFCVVRTIRDFGVVSSTFVTTFRKILSIWLSFLMFPKPFSTKYAFAILIFIAGIGFQIKWKGSPKQKEKVNVTPMHVPKTGGDQQV